MRLLTRCLVTAAVAVAWLNFLAPTGLGGPVGLIWVSGTSMEPGLHTGDLVVVYEHDNYEVGDIVAFDIPGGGKVIHRIIESTDEGYRFQGDNREFADPWILTDDDIIGSAALELPHTGSVFTVLGSPVGMSSLVMLMILLWWIRPRPVAASEDEPANTDR